MAFTQSDVDKLKAAIATGALRVRFADREVTYRSLEEMRESLRLMCDEIARVAGTPRRRQVRFMTAKGV